MVAVLKSDIPEGYVLGLGRDEPRPKVAHLYEGTFGSVGRAMCRRGYNRPDGWSIWRGNLGSLGVCATCLRRARAGSPPVEWPSGGGD